MAHKVHPFTSNYNSADTVAVDDAFAVKLLWTHAWHHYSPASQWRGWTQKAPCRNRAAEEEASAFPLPCQDEPPTEDTESSATLCFRVPTFAFIYSLLFAVDNESLRCEFWQWMVAIIWQHCELSGAQLQYRKVIYVRGTASYNTMLWYKLLKYCGITKNCQSDCEAERKL